jgi:hypothetical protein
MTGSEKKARIPPFRSDQAERDFWARHSVEEFAEGLTDLEIEIRPPRTEQIAFRLYKDDLEVLRSLAAARGVGTRRWRDGARRLARALAKQRRKRRAAGESPVSLYSSERHRLCPKLCPRGAKSRPNPPPANVDNKNPSVSSTYRGSLSARFIGAVLSS